MEPIELESQNRVSRMDSVRVKIWEDEIGYLWTIQKPRRFFGWKVVAFGGAETFEEAMVDIRPLLKEIDGTGAAERF